MRSASGSMTSSSPSAPFAPNRTLGSVEARVTLERTAETSAARMLDLDGYRKPTGAC